MLHQKKAIKFIGLISCFFLLFFLLIACNTKIKEKKDNNIYLNIGSYFKSHNWDFPISIIDSILIIKYYPDSETSNNIPKQYTNTIEAIKKLFYNKQNIKILLSKTLTDTLKDRGYLINNTRIDIDTIESGNIKVPKIYLVFNVAVYKINTDSNKVGIPCEDCILEENRKIIKYPHGLFFELNKTEDSLIFSRWD